MEQFETENWIFEANIYGYITPFILTEHYKFYGGDRNVVRAYYQPTSTLSGQFTLSVSLNNYQTALTYLSENGVVEADITSAVRLGGELTFTLTNGSTTEIVTFGTNTTATSVEGMNPNTFASVISKQFTRCDDQGNKPLTNSIPLPDTILNGTKILYTNNVQMGINADTFVNATFSGGCLVTIADNIISFVQKYSDGDQKYRWRLKELADGVRYGTLYFTPNIAKPIGSQSDGTLPQLQMVVEINEMTTQCKSTELDTIGNGYKRNIDGIVMTAKIGLSDLTAYDYAYYSSMLLTATNVVLEINDNVQYTYDCMLKTDKMTVKSGAFGKYKFEVELNLYNNAD